MGECLAGLCQPHSQPLLPILLAILDSLQDQLTVIRKRNREKEDEVGVERDLKLAELAKAKYAY